MPAVNKLAPGESLTLVLERMSPSDRPLFLQYLEPKMRREGRLEELREIRAYHRLVESRKR